MKPSFFSDPLRLIFQSSGSNFSLASAPSPWTRLSRGKPVMAHPDRARMKFFFLSSAFFSYNFQFYYKKNYQITKSGQSNSV